MRISDWSSDVCSSDLLVAFTGQRRLDQFGDRRRLVARRLVIAHDLETLSPFRLLGPVGAVRNERRPRLGFGEAGANLDRHGANMVGDAAWFQCRRCSAIGQSASPLNSIKIGSASGRERVCQYG